MKDFSSIVKQPIHQLKESIRTVKTSLERFSSLSDEAFSKWKISKKTFHEVMSMQSICNTMISVCNSRIRVAIILSISLLAATSLLQNYAYAENPQEEYEQAKLAAELEFAETIQKAKERYRAIISEPDVDSETKMKAKQEYNKTIEDAKILRDQKIEEAKRKYDEAINVKSQISLEEARIQYLAAIKEAKITLETSLEQAKENFDQAISHAINDEEIEQLEKEYKDRVAEIKRIYNETITSAKAEFDKIRHMHM